jgi:hypothetical protein
MACEATPRTEAPALAFGLCLARDARAGLNLVFETRRPWAFFATKASVPGTVVAIIRSAQLHERGLNLDMTGGRTLLCKTHIYPFVRSPVLDLVCFVKRLPLGLES